LLIITSKPGKQRVVHVSAIAFEAISSYVNSLPTRRSSDLAHVMKSVEEADQVVTPHRVVVGTRNFEVTLLENAILFGQISGFPKDRKSTRLNSSHVKISYAVFCLKKKKWRVRGQRGLDPNP